ncbi:MAG TPA: ABC transporter substrate-binding protein [Aquaticitalea sp.]|nr:ABC transporter substrate-binding protein [Aquaticitalea sp.]
MKKTILLFIFCSLLNCKDDKKPIGKFPLLTENVFISYAEGFSITKFQDYSILEINNPWPKVEKSYRFALVPEEKAATVTLNPEEFDAILLTPIKKIVVTSTTHIPALELLGVEHTLVGFPGTDYISSEKTRKRINENAIRELGKNEGINTEVLLELKPDVVVGFGIDGNNKTFETIKKSGIPVMYNGDWVETSPLAKAEWIKVFGVLYNKEAQADSIFDAIESEYLQAKTLAAKVKSQPTVLSGAMHKDIWYLPSGSSAEAQLLKDANANYLWADTTEKGSLSLNFETVFEKAKDADIWISPSYYPSLEAIEKANEHYTKLKAFQTENVYSFVNKTGETGGVLYFELGMARPDLVLKDLVKICHPGLLQDYEPFFFKKLE